MKQRIWVGILAVALALSPALAQQAAPTPAAGQPPVAGSPGQGGAQPGEMQGMQGGMRGAPMGAQMCDPRCAGMMERAMKAYPWMLAYGVVFGVLSLVALALLVVLEILWIRLWSLRVARLKAEPMPKE